MRDLFLEMIYSAAKIDFMIRVGWLRVWMTYVCVCERATWSVETTLSKSADPNLRINTNYKQIERKNKTKQDEQTSLWLTVLRK